MQLIPGEEVRVGATGFEPATSASRKSRAFAHQRRNSLYQLTLTLPTGRGDLHVITLFALGALYSGYDTPNVVRADWLRVGVSAAS